MLRIFTITINDIDVIDNLILNLKDERELEPELVPEPALACAGPWATPSLPLPLPFSLPLLSLSFLSPTLPPP